MQLFWMHLFRMHLFRMHFFGCIKTYLNGDSIGLTLLSSHRYILYVSAVDQSLSVDDRRTSMAIVEVRIQGSIEDRPKREPEKLPQDVLATSSGEEKQLKMNSTDEFLAEAKRKVFLKRQIKIDYKYYGELFIKINAYYYILTFLYDYD